METTELVLRDARLVDGRQVDIHTLDGLVHGVHEAGVEDFANLPCEMLDGWLILPAMTEPHAHLDKALTAESVPNATGDLEGAIAAWVSAASAGQFSFEDTANRALTAMELLLVHGVTAVRTHVNVGNGTQGLEAVLEARRHMEGLIDVQVVALTNVPMTGQEGRTNRAALTAAIEAGADLVGGCPHLDPDGPGLIGHALEVATEAGIGLDLHMDEDLDPSVLTLRDLARQVIDTGFAHPVSASHCVSLGMQSPEVQAEIAARVAEAGISVFPLPQTNLFLQGRGVPTATPRGLTAIAALREAGVVVAAGADNVQDPFNLVGRSDPLETASLLVMAGHQSPADSYSMVSTCGRQALGLPEASIQPGDVADLVAIDAPSIRAAIADAPMSRRVFRHGVLVASADQQISIHRAS
ncbi:MAG: amidohydrolase family protein [Acidimicrobiales bacterium]|nr:amidohydrolase family protein [Acidimicrobiales bacterium]